MKVVITPLGTISPYPKGNKNCPGFLVEYKDQKILLDCGNGITRLLKFPDDLKNLHVIVTHYHKDHFGDLGSLQYASYTYRNLGLLENKIKIYLPREEYHGNKKAILETEESYADYLDIADNVAYQIDDLKITFHDSRSHTIPSYMIKLENKDVKIVYTSDIGTTNFQETIQFCKDSDIIICESSFLVSHHANSKTHLKALDAGKLARLAKTKKLVLTHLWPEEDQNLYLEEAKKEFSDTVLAEEEKKIMIESGEKMEISERYARMEEEETEKMIQTLDRILQEKNQNSDKVIDLHTHTNYSDGELSPQELVHLAITKNVATLAITDHDTVEGVKHLDRSDPFIIESGIKVIDGIELSAKVSHGQMHILGYNIDIHNEELNKEMSKLRDNSINSVLSVMEVIKKDYGIVFTYEDIKNLVNANHNLGRPDIARLCIKYGYATSVKDAFDKYLIEANKKIGSFKKGIPYEECIDFITKSGGIPVLAHPKSLELSEKEFLQVLKDMIQCGLKGIEVYHSTHTEEEMDYYLKIAKQYDLLVSGGSDFHGNNTKPDIELGSGKNQNLKIKKLSLVKHIQ